MEKRPTDEESRKRAGADPRAAFGNTFSPEELSRLDPYVVLVLQLLAAEDWVELLFRTGVRQDPLGTRPQYFSFLVRLRTKGIESAELDTMLKKLRLEVPPVYFEELQQNDQLDYVTARIAVDPRDPGRLWESENSLIAQIAVILASPLVRSLDLAVSHQPCLHESLLHSGLGFPVDRTYKGKSLTGDGVIVGIIDDGCAFAHPNFLTRLPGAGGGFSSRILALWDQSQPPTPADLANGWVDPPAGGYGRELTRAFIDKAINANVSSSGVVDEDAVYEHLRYEVGARDDLSSHGTHVMDIAAGNGSSLMGSEGVAPNSDIVFVQLPPVAIENPGPALSKAIVDAVAYVFAAAKKKKPVVVNLSYGGNRGPHDETWPWSDQIDQLLVKSNRAVVVSAGNGFEQDTHAPGKLTPGSEMTLRWILLPEDPTSNDLELWYNGDAQLEVELEAPGGAKVFGPYLPASIDTLQRPGDGKIVGWISHLASVPDLRVLIALRATIDEPPTPAVAPALAGTWLVRLRNNGTKTAEIHAWIQRDDAGQLGGRRQQSRFHPDDARPGHTVCDYACGLRTISVGAFNGGRDVNDEEICRYSACGPTRPPVGTSGRTKPDVCAPAEEDFAGQGVLSASSRRAQPTRMNGTSASAPHVTGIIALILEYATKYGGTSLTAEQIRKGITDGAQKGKLRGNAHQAADDRVQFKQKDMMADVIGAGRVDFRETMKKLFP